MSPISSTLANASAYGYRSFAAAGPVDAFYSIASANGSGSSNELTFSSIPSTYESLQLRIFTKVTDTSDDTVQGINLYFNGSTSSEYGYHAVSGTGSTGSTLVTTDSAISFPTIGIYIRGNVRATSGTTHGSMIIDLHDYASTTRNKTLRAFSGAEINTTASRINLTSGMWQNTAAISSIRIVSSGGDFATTARFSLYGIKGA
jgi:hypothetical protein